MAKTMPVATFEQIRSASDVATTVDVPIKEWGVTVVIRGLKRGEIKDIHVAAEKSDDPGETMDMLTLVAGVVTPKLDEAQAAEILKEKGMAPVKAVLAAIMEASGIGGGFRPEKAG